jgi:hypothetical protein
MRVTQASALQADRRLADLAQVQAAGAVAEIDASLSFVMELSLNGRNL